MRKSLGRALIASVLLSLFLPAPAQAATVNYNCGTSGTYQVDNVTNTVTGHTSCVGALNIQAGVTSIANYAFQNNTQLTTVTIPASVTSIGSSAFNGAYISGLTFNEGLTTINAYAFANVYTRGIDINITFPDSLVTIGASAFSQSYFKGFSIGANVSTIGNSAFYNNFNTGANNIVFRGTSAVTVLDHFVFIGYQGTELILPPAITSIGQRPFEGAPSLTNLLIPTGVTTIATNAFINMPSLETLIFPDGLTTLGSTLFTGSTNVRNILYCGSSSTVLNYTYPNATTPTCARGVVYSANGGTGTMAPSTGTTTAALRSNSFTRNGFSFLGWNTKADGTGTSYSNNANYSFTSNMVLYAQWGVPDVTSPSFLTTAAQSKSENQTLVANIVVSESATITINGGSDQGKFSLARVADSATSLAFITAPDFEAPTDSNANNTYIVALRATDGSGNIGYETYTVTITDIAEQIAVVTSSISRTLQKGVANNLSLTFDSAVKATFLFNGKKIAGCVAKPSATSSPFTVTCSFKPTIHGAGTLSVRYSEISGINYGGTTSLGSIGVVKRSNRR